MKKLLSLTPKKILIAISPYVKYLLFFLMVWHGINDLYIERFDLYINKYVFLFFYFLICIYISYCSNKNKELDKLNWGKAAYDYLIVELFFFALFAQYFVIVSILIVAVAVVCSISFHCYIQMKCKSNGSKRHNRANAVICLLLCFVLLVPSFIGFDKEYISPSATSDEWEKLVASFKADYGAKDDEDLFNKYDKVIDELASWEKLNTDDRTTLLKKVALIEKENLGIEDADFLVIGDKLDEYSCGFYSYEENQIYLNSSQISHGDLQDCLITVCHEVFHAYEYYVVENIDFDSEMVQNNYYFENARKWKNNIDNYVPSVIDYDMYYDQPLEKDARQYAEDRVTAYTKIISAD